MSMVRWFKNANNKCPHNWRKDACKRFSRLWERILGFRPIKKWWGEDYFKVREATAELLALYIGFLSKTQERRREALVIGDETIHRGDYFILLFHLNMALFLVCNYLVFTFSAFQIFFMELLLGLSGWNVGIVHSVRICQTSRKPGKPERSYSARMPQLRTWHLGSLCQKSGGHFLPVASSSFWLLNRRQIKLLRPAPPSRC